MKSFDKTIKMRLRRLDVENPPVCDIKNIGRYTLIESNRWRGLKDDNGVIVLDPIYDTIDLMDNSDMCIIELKDSVMLFDLLHKSIVALPQMDAYRMHGGALEIITSEGTGLFSCRLRKLLIEPKYAETTHSDCGRFLWIRDKNDKFAFFDTETLNIIKCPNDTQRCLDSVDSNQMFIVIENEVKCINESGCIDNHALRMYALNQDGRITLFNQHERNTIITDIYGHIIN